MWLIELNIAGHRFTHKLPMTAGSGWAGADVACPGARCIIGSPAPPE